jgi:hypothetical protein
MFFLKEWREWVEQTLNESFDWSDALSSDDSDWSHIFGSDDEDEKSPQVDFPKDELGLIVDESGDSVEIMLFSTHNFAVYNRTMDSEGVLLGHIMITPTKSDEGPCYNSLQVQRVVAEKGYGPFLYDVAMRYATKKGLSLSPSRTSLSKSAAGIWRYYHSKRHDVESSPFDNLDSPKTPPPEDDCKVFGADFLDKTYTLSDQDAERQIEYLKNAQNMIKVLGASEHYVSQHLSGMSNMMFGTRYKGAEYEKG